MNQDQDHLWVLSIGHYIVAVLAGLLSFFPLPYLMLGLAALFGSADPSATVIGRPFGGRLIVVLFIIIFALLMAAGMVYAVLMARAGTNLRTHHKHRFCLTMASISFIFLPFGTLLGILTLTVLLRPSVKELFDGESGGEEIRPAWDPKAPDPRP